MFHVLRAVKLLLPHPVLLLIDSATGHPQALTEMCHQTHAVFTPANDITSILQPTDQGAFQLSSLLSKVPKTVIPVMNLDKVNFKSLGRILHPRCH